MIKISNLETFGWDAAIRGMRNPMNSWEKSDSGFVNGKFVIGINDLQLMKKLINSGACERKFFRMITVQCDIEAPLYWWKEFDTYKVGTVANSCSTMHKIHSEPISLDNFSNEKMTKEARNLLEKYVAIIEAYRENYNKKGDIRFWNTIIQLLPASWNQKRTVQFNYEVVKQWWIWRKNHKLSEWMDLIEFLMKNLPHAGDLIV